MEFLPTIANILAGGLVVGIIVYVARIKSGFVQEISAICSRLTALETKIDLFWGAVESKMVDMLKCLTTLPKDILLDKMIHRDISLSEAQELRTVLKEEYEHKQIDNGTRLAYVFTLARIEQMIVDLRGKK